MVSEQLCLEILQFFLGQKMKMALTRYADDGKESYKQETSV